MKQISIKSINVHIKLEFGLPDCLGVSRLFLLLFEDNTIRPGYTEYFFPKAKIKVYDVMVNGQSVFDHSLRTG